MNALQDMKNLIDREVGMVGWRLHEVEAYWRDVEVAYLETQRGVIPFSTLKLLVEMIPEVLESIQGLDDEQRGETWQDGYDQGRHEGYEEGLEEGLERSE